MADTPDKRRFQRHPTRIRCRIRFDEQEHSGFVTDMSANGLFVQCANKPQPGAKVVLVMECDAGAPLVMTGTVAREKKVHRGAAAIAHGGVGVELESAPEGYFQLIMDRGD